jgi:small redox-active disulfide protein 2
LAGGRLHWVLASNQQSFFTKAHGLKDRVQEELKMLTIKVLGSGCANCRKLEETARKAVAWLGVEAQVDKVTDITDIMSYNVLTTPGLVINEKLVSSGRLPSAAEVTSWLTDAMMAAEEG